MANDKRQMTKDKKEQLSPAHMSYVICHMSANGVRA